MIIGIACVQANTWCIGDTTKGKGNLLYHIKCDMDFFKKKTWNNICVMGYGCFKSLPNMQPLPGRLNIVLCSQDKIKTLPAGVIGYSDLNKLLTDIKVWSKDMTVCILGGGMFYKTMLPYYDIVYITKVYDKEKKGNVYFPNLDKETDFEICDNLKDVQTKKYKLDFITYRKKR